MAPLRYRQIFDFYWPLVLTSQMMTLATPIINMGLGRSSDPKIELAAYGVGFSLLVLMNSPLFPFVQTVTVMGVGAASRRSLIRKGLALGVAIACLQLLLGLHPWGARLIAQLMGSTPAVTALAQKVALVQFPIALLLPIRSFFYAVVMRHKRTVIISQATAGRLGLLSAVIFGAIGFGHMPGALLGGASLTIGILTETLYVAVRALRLIKRDAAGINESGADEPVGWNRFFDFIAPLMVNAITWTSMRALLNAIIGRSSDPDLAQAGFGIVFPLLVLSASPLWAFNSTTVVLAKRREDLPPMLRFGGVTICFFILSIALVVYTPLRDWLLGAVFSLEGEMMLYVAPALMLIPYEPLTLGLRTISQGFLMARERTRIIGVASFLKIVLVAICGFPLVHNYPDFNGALLGTLLLMGGETVETVIIVAKLRSVYRGIAKSSETSSD
jgi:hypothetical protein